MRPLTKVMSFEVEALDAPVLAVGDVDYAVLVDLYGVKQMELSGPHSRLSPLAHPVSITGVFEDTGIRVTVGDEYVTIGREGQIGSSTKVTGTDFGQSAHRDLHQLLPVGGELQYFRTCCVRSPDIPLRIAAKGVGHAIHAPAQGMQHGALAMQTDHRT